MTLNQYRKRITELNERKETLAMMYVRPDMAEDRRAIEIATEGVLREIIELEREWALEKTGIGEDSQAV
jgi:hypothetical protein